jgi:hypothetical protein
MQEFSASHPYTQRFEKTLTRQFRRHSRGAKKRFRALPLKVIHTLDGQSDVRRDDLMEKLRADTVTYTQTEIDDMIKRLHRTHLIYVERGRYSRVTIA